MIRHHELTKLFYDIVRGYSEIETPHGILFIRHSDLKIESELERVYTKAFNRAIKQGLITTKDKLYELNKNDIWTDENEKQIKDKETFLYSLQKSKNKQILPSQKNIIQEQIEIQELDIKKLIDNKNELIGNTADIFALKIKNKQYIIKNSFKSNNLIDTFFDEEYIDDDMFNDIYISFSFYFDKFNEKNLKSISISEEFSLYFLTSEDSVLNFYGIPAIKLTILQAQLFHFGRYFREIMKQESYSSVPIDIKSDPDKLVEWFEAKKAGNDILESKKNNTEAALVGATKEDLKALGFDKLAPKVDYASEARKRGGSLSMEEILSMQGD